MVVGRFMFLSNEGSWVLVLPCCSGLLYIFISLNHSISETDIYTFRTALISETDLIKQIK